MGHHLHVLAAVLLVAGCGQAVGGGGADAEAFFGRQTWQLSRSSVDGADLVVPEGHRVTLRYTDGKRDDEYDVGGTASCNGYGARVDVTGSSVSFGTDLSRTERLCSPPEAMAAEDAYLAALPRVTRGERSGDSLVLTGDGVRLEFALQPPAPVAALVGATWVLTGLVDGDTVGSVAGAPATLRLEEDGSMSGSTGCRGLKGEYTVNGDEVLLGTFGADAVTCPDELAAQDGHVTTVLGDGFRAAVDDEGTLTLGDTSGLGLRYSRSLDGPGDGPGGPGTTAGPPAEDDADPADDLFGPGDWQLVEGSVDGSDIVVPDGFPVTIRAVGEGTVSGTAACNGYSTSVSVSGSTLTVGSFPTRSAMGCLPDGVMTAEAAYLEALPRVTTGERTAGTLILTGQGVRLEFEPETSGAPEPSATGTTTARTTATAPSGATTAG